MTSDSTQARLDLESARGSDEFTLIEIIGVGGFGLVYKAVHNATRREVAIKTMPMVRGSSIWPMRNRPEELLREVRFLENYTTHPNIVAFYSSFVKRSTNALETDELWIVMELCGSGSIKDLIRGNEGTLSQEWIAYICKGTLSALSYLHINGVIHRDIKSMNILMTSDYVVKVADFGLSTRLQSRIIGPTPGTLQYIAPEVLNHEAYTAGADIWSLGITAIEMAQGLPPHTNTIVASRVVPRQEINTPQLEDPGRWSAEFNDFVAQCLNRNWRARWSADQLLSHPFIRDCSEEQVKSEIGEHLTNNANRGGN